MIKTRKSNTTARIVLVFVLFIHFAYDAIENCCTIKINLKHVISCNNGAQHTRCPLLLLGHCLISVLPWPPPPPSTSTTIWTTMTTAATIKHKRNQFTTSMSNHIKNEYTPEVKDATRTRNQSTIATPEKKSIPRCKKKRLTITISIIEFYFYDELSLSFLSASFPFTLSSILCHSFWLIRCFATKIKLWTLRNFEMMKRCRRSFAMRALIHSVIITWIFCSRKKKKNASVPFSTNKTH